jgi:hypothetical protein
MKTTIAQRADLTFKHNLKQGRHGWLRLTPAYSVKVVQDGLERVGKPERVLDPFAGTGTTGLVCAERGIACDLVEINPFLVWFAQAKTRNYTATELNAAAALAHAEAKQARQNVPVERLWIPPIHHVERWWTPERLTTLARLFHPLRSVEKSPALDLVRIAFCCVAINWSHAAFNHQSMSFKQAQTTLFPQDERDLIADDFLHHVQQITASARQPLSGEVTVYNGDSRSVHAMVPQRYDCVITSPPYPNRMSYIRELRPYMYWLGFLSEAREAGDMDWEAIGGTWGVATSRLAQWTPNDAPIDHDGFEGMIRRIAQESALLANYVHKYFSDMSIHFTSLTHVLAPGAKLFYIVGNSKFYDTLVPVEEIYASLMRQCGLRNVSSEPLRKRNSKKELYEFVVSGEWV